MRPRMGFPRLPVAQELNGLLLIHIMLMGSWCIAHTEQYIRGQPLLAHSSTHRGAKEDVGDWVYGARSGWHTVEDCVSLLFGNHQRHKYVHVLCFVCTCFRVEQGNFNVFMVASFACIEIRLSVPRARARQCGKCLLPGVQRATI